MCGIFAFINGSSKLDEKSLYESYMKVSYRGPDESNFLKLNDNTFFGFHRLSIMDLSNSGSQPMYLSDNPSVTLICNGEIYNYLEIAERYNFEMESGSDSEVILHLYKIMPFALISSMGIIISSTDIILLGLIESNQAVSLYRVGLMFGSFISVALSVATILFIPLISKEGSISASLKKKSINSARFCALLGSLLLIFYFFFPLNPVYVYKKNKQMHILQQY